MSREHQGHLLGKDYWTIAREILRKKFQIEKPDPALDYMRTHGWAVTESKEYWGSVISLNFTELNNRPFHRKLDFSKVRSILTGVITYEATGQLVVPEASEYSSNSSPLYSIKDPVEIQVEGDLIKVISRHLKKYFIETEYMELTPDDSIRFVSQKQTRLPLLSDCSQV